MLTNPFGTAVNAEVVKSYSRYRGHAITREDCAREAMRMIHAGRKNMDALHHAGELKSSHGSGVSAMVLVYNATGDKLELVDSKDWDGSSVYHEEPPSSFLNGQWISFLHAHPGGRAVGCEGARVFRGFTSTGEVRDFLVAWTIPWGWGGNRAYTEVREKDYFKDKWGDIKNKLDNANKITIDESDQYCASTVSIGGYSTSECIAVLHHKFRPLPGEEE
uniref:Uncharacterized protein n=1 Tax=Leersia perrieri TaxID=77586 RepID=A0A0D9W3D5_9ORYZ